MVLTALALVWLLARSGTAMAAAGEACRLFAESVLPGLFLYMVPALMLASRLPERTPDVCLVWMGWCGGSPAGARLLALRSGLDRRRYKRMAVACATMSPMFLLGTAPQWTGSPVSGCCLLAASAAGGWVTGCLAGRLSTAEGHFVENSAAQRTLSFSEAVMQAAGTMLTVCGTMMLLRAAAALVGELLAGRETASLMVVTLLEVTSGVKALAGLPLPLSVRTALMAAATGFGGTAILLQNRAAYPDDLMSLCEQLLWQAVHGLLSGGIAYALMLLAGG